LGKYRDRSTNYLQEEDPKIYAGSIRGMDGGSKFLRPGIFSQDFGLPKKPFPLKSSKGLQTILVKKALRGWIKG